MIELLERNTARPADAVFKEWVHVYVDASFQPAGYCGVGGAIFFFLLGMRPQCSSGTVLGVGGAIYDSSGKCLSFFSEQVSQELLNLMKRDGQETVIFKPEGLGIAAALHLFRPLVRGKRVVVFADNQATQSCFVKCKSKNDHMNLIIRSTCSVEETLGLVTSMSNPSESCPGKSPLLGTGCRPNWPDKPLEHVPLRGRRAARHAQMRRRVCPQRKKERAR